MFQVLLAVDPVAALLELVVNMEDKECCLEGFAKGILRLEQMHILSLPQLVQLLRDIASNLRISSVSVERLHVTYKAGTAKTGNARHATTVQKQTYCAGVRLAHKLATSTIESSTCGPDGVQKMRQLLIRRVVHQTTPGSLAMPKAAPNAKASAKQKQKTRAEMVHHRVTQKSRSNSAWNTFCSKNGKLKGHKVGSAPHRLEQARLSKEFKELTEVQRESYTKDAEKATADRHTLTQQGLVTATTADVDLSMGQQQRLGQRMLNVTLQQLRGHPFWNTGLQLWSPDAALRPEFVDTELSREAAAVLVKELAGFDPTVVPNPKHRNKLGRQHTCHCKHGGLCKKDHDVSLVAACVGFLEQYIKCYSLAAKTGIVLLKFCPEPPLAPLYLFLASTAKKPWLTQVCISFTPTSDRSEGTVKLQLGHAGAECGKALDQTTHAAIQSITSSPLFADTFSVFVLDYTCCSANGKLQITAGETTHVIQLPPSEQDLASVAAKMKEHSKRKKKPVVKLSFGLTMPPAKKRVRRAIQKTLASESGSDSEAPAARPSQSKAAASSDAPPVPEKADASGDVEFSSTSESSDGESLPDVCRKDLSGVRQLKKHIRKAPPTKDASGPSATKAPHKDSLDADQKDRKVKEPSKDTFFHKELGICGIGLAPSGRSVCVCCTKRIGKNEVRFEYAFSKKRPQRNLHATESCLGGIIQEHRKQSLEWVSARLASLKKTDLVMDAHSDAMNADQISLLHDALLLGQRVL